jgi:HK97 family phage portal protein
LITPQKVVDIKLSDSKLWYFIEGRQDPIPQERMIHVPHLGEDPIKGKSTITYAREDLGLEISRRDTGGKFWNDGGRPEGLLIPKVKLNAEQKAELKEDFKKKKKEGGTVMLPIEMTYQALSMSPADQEFLTSGNFSVATICRWFGVPLDKLMELQRATHSNIEHQAIAFLQDTITPIVNKIEDEYSTKCFTLDSEENTYLEFNLDAYQRADSAAQAELMRSEIQNGTMTPNEWRRLKNRMALNGGDDLYMQLNMAPLSKLEQIQMSKKPGAVARVRAAELKKIFQKTIHTNGIDH